MVTIRPCRKSDQIDIMHVCFKCGYMGEDAAGHFSDQKLFGLLFCLYYPRYEPEHCFVAEDHGRVVGYILGTPNTQRQRRLFFIKMGYRILARLLFVTSWRYFRDFNLVVQMMLSALTRAPEDAIAISYPAHLHIDLLPTYQRQGIGTGLMQRFERQMRQLKVQGIHLGTSEGNRKAIPFYQKHKYQIIRTENAGMWPDAREKRGLIFAKTLD